MIKRKVHYKHSTKHRLCNLQTKDLSAVLTTNQQPKSWRNVTVKADFTPDFSSCSLIYSISVRSFLLLKYICKSIATKISKMTVTWETVLINFLKYNSKIIIFSSVLLYFMNDKYRFIIKIHASLL